MRAGPLFVILLILSLGLAGCLKGPAVSTASVNNSTGDFNKLDPNKGQALVAFEETNSTENGAGGLNHQHDYWGGQTRIVLFDVPTAMDPNPGTGGTSADFRPPQGKLVYEGTGTIEFTISDPERHGCVPGFTLDGDYICSDNAAAAAPHVPDATGGSSGLVLRYKHATTKSWVDVGELKWGTPLTIKITDPLQTDMPHATASLWQFEVASPNTQDRSLSFHAKAEMIRGEGPIPTWPGHPNFYADKCCREVINNASAEACDGSAGCALASPDAGPQTPARLVSYGTRTLHVWLNISSFTAPNPATAPTNWFLFHENATGRTNLTDPFSADSKTDKKSFYWILPVDDNGMDSPYAEGSRWSFQLGGSLTTPVISCDSGCSDWAAKYSLVVHATNEVLPKEQYTYNCLRKEECPTS